jgi:hypothetical protein
LRTACLIEYLARRYSVDAIIFREPGAPDPRAAIASGLLRSVQVIDLPYHSKSTFARFARNVGRFTRNAPPLMDRFGGFPLHVSRRYDLGVIEHFWCATYVADLRRHCDRIVLDLHNIESVLLERSAATHDPVSGTFFRRFASASRALESELLPAFDTLLVTSKPIGRSSGLASFGRIQSPPCLSRKSKSGTKSFSRATWHTSRICRQPAILRGKSGPGSAKRTQF